MGRTCIFFVLALLFVACNNQQENAREQAAKELTTSGEQSDFSGKDMLADLRAQAVQEDDKTGRIAQTLKPLREEYAKSEKVMPNLKEVKVEVDEHCVLHIYNQANGKEEIRVDLLKLDLQGGFSLIPDLSEQDYPGLRIRTLGGESAVELYRDGELIEAKEALEIYMAERQNIERITPVMVQLLRICRDLE